MARVELGTVLIFAAVSASGCTLLADGQLEDKRSVAGTGGQGGDGGTGGSTTTSGSTTDSGMAGSGGTGSGSSTGSGDPCPKDKANCDGLAWNGCEVNLEKDDDHCGNCEISCKGGEHCEEGHCK